MPSSPPAACERGWCALCTVKKVRQGEVTSLAQVHMANQCLAAPSQPLGMHLGIPLPEYPVP